MLYQTINLMRSVELYTIESLHQVFLQYSTY